MRFEKEEIKRARALRRLGFGWKVQVGHWFVTDDGFVSFVKGHGDAESCGSRHTWLPGWQECRRWLLDQGYSHPEIVVDEPDWVCIEIRSEGGEVLRQDGVSDLSCLYALMGELIKSEDRDLC